jgi:RNA polymerase-binding transcription factor DksA
MGKSSKSTGAAKASAGKSATGRVAAKPASPAKAAAAAKPAAPKPAAKAASAPAAKATPAKAAPAKPAAKAPAAAAKPATGAVAKAATNGASSASKAAANGANKAPTNGSSKIAIKEAPVQVKYKCPFPSDELAKWRELLLFKRHEISDDIAGLVKDAMEAEDGHTTPNHIAERGSDADLQDLSLGVAGEEKDVVWQIDRALRKIEAAKPLPFGLCEFTKEMIPRTRLQLIPWTPLSIEGATHMEKSNLELEDLLVDD